MGREVAHGCASALRAGCASSGLVGRRSVQVSRKTGYKWLERYELVGPAGLVDRSHRPYSCPHATPAPIVQQHSGVGVARCERCEFPTV